MTVWPSFAAMAVLAFIGPVLTQNSPAVMPGVRSRSSSLEMTGRRRRPDRVRIPLSPDAQLKPIFFPPNLHRMYGEPAVGALPTESGVEAVGEGAPTMVMADDMDIDKLDIDHLRMLNSISTKEEFAAMFGLEMAVAANDSDIVARFGASGSKVNLPLAKCQPENKTVVLDLPAEKNVLYSPSCVRLQRCGGCCHGSIFVCRPTKTEAISIEVIRVAPSITTRTQSLGAERGRGRPGRDTSQSLGAERGRGRPGRDTSQSLGAERGRGRPGRDTSTRRERRNTAEIITVPEEQHIECDCQCRIQEQDCNPVLHEYMPSNCRCQCLNSDEEEKCAPKPMTHYWDDEQCTCFCLKTVNCSVTLRFDHTTCSCVKIPPNPLPHGGSVTTPRAGSEGNNALDERSERLRRNHIPISFGRDARREGREGGPGR